MDRLTVFLSKREVSRPSKVLAILGSLGGIATAEGIRSAGVAAGVPDLGKWGVPSILKRERAFVVLKPEGWTLLPEGRAHLERLGFFPEEKSRRSADHEVQCIAIGHGHSAVWKDLRHFLEHHFQCKTIEFNSKSAAGVTTIERLREMLDESTMAFLVATAEDGQVDGQLRARQNVVHEAGLFQGRHGFERAIVLFENGCEGFSNVDGLGHIKFAPGNIMSASEEIRAYLRDRIKLPLR